MKILYRLLIVVYTGCALLGAVASAQTTSATVTGVVTDKNGAALPNTQVTMTNLATQVRFTTITNNSGIYRISDLLPGAYKGVASHSGFKKTVKNGITLSVDDHLAINFLLQVGTVTENISVSAGAPAINTESSSVSEVVGSREIRDQPLNGRNIYDLEAVAPGVIAQGGTNQQAAMSQIWANNNYQIGGGFGNDSTTFVDGTPINVNYAQGSALTPTQDSIQEFKIVTNDAGPEWGPTGGGIVNMEIRSGTDAFHGTAYDYVRNKVLNANTFFADQANIPKPAFTQNQFGAALGGPIVRNHAFFFFDWEGFILNQGSTTETTVPTAAERKGDFSAPGLPKIYDPCAGDANVNANNTCITVPAQRTQFPGNVIPASRLDPTAVASENIYFPLPNAPGVENYIYNYTIGENSNQYTARIDDNISSKQHIFGHYIFNRGIGAPEYILGSDIGLQRSPTTTTSVVLGDDYTINPTTVANIRVSFLRFTWLRDTLANPSDVTKFAWPAAFNTEFEAPGGPGLGITGFAGSYGSDILTAANNNYLISGTITKVLGHHTLTFGGEAERLDDNYGQGSGASTGSFGFSNAMTSINPANPGDTGFSYASFLLGYGTGGSAVQLKIPAGGQHYQGYFFNDEYKATPNLTLDLGVRWEQPGAFTARHDLATVFLADAASPLGSSVGGMPLKGNFALVNTPEWSKRTTLQEHWNLFAPRLGFAYRMNDKTSIHSGAGEYFPPVGYNLYLSPAFSPINNGSTPWIASLNGGITPYNTLHNPFPNGVVEPEGRNPNFETDLPLYGSSPISPEPDQPPTRIYQWNVGIDRELGGGWLLNATYAGARGTHLPAATQNVDWLPDGDLAQGAQLLKSVPNPFFGIKAAGSVLATEPSLPKSQLELPFPQFTGVQAAGMNDRDSYYESLQMKLERRFGSGGDLLAAYTLARLVDNVDTLTSWSESEAGFKGASGDQDPNNLRGERSLSAQDVPQNLVVSYVLDLPFGRGEKFLSGVQGFSNELASGWSADGMSTFQAGFPVGISNGIPAVFGGNRPNVVPGCKRAVTGLPVAARLNDWFNAACFSEPPAFSYGNEPREDPTIRGGGVDNYNVALAKEFKVSERVGLIFRSEFFNLFNHPQFTPTFASTLYGIPGFGTGGNQVNNPRLVQFALRMMF